MTVSFKFGDFLIAMSTSDKAKETLVPESFVCVECGATQTQLYIEYGKGNIKLVKCVCLDVVLPRPGRAMILGHPT